MTFLFSFESSYITSVLKFIIMGYPTKIQLIKREASEQWYINLPSAVAQAMEFKKGEIVEWVIKNKDRMELKRTSSLDLESKKKLSK